EAVNVLRKGLPRASRYRHLYYYNMGNAFVLQGKNSFAAEMFGEAISIDAQYAPAYLNRANARLALRQYREASEDYGRYLVLDPATTQRTAIEELLRRLGASLAEEDRLKAEAAAQALAAEAARQALLTQVSASLKAAAEETTNLSAGSGQVQGYGDTLELND
ncbi:MAG: hypothetical protein JNG85_03940, partial [Spirochaetaceae bacterium]|nr:hypothetical protein [Spirochaetaceae bacterium]